MIDIKITGIKINTKEIPLIEPFRISSGVSSVSITSIVEVETDEGLIGYGEGVASRYVTGENLEGMIRAINIFGEAITNLNPLDIEQIYWKMESLMIRNPAAKAAVDIAIHDLIGKILQQPLYKVLGGYRNYVVTDLSLGIDEPAIMAQKAIKAIKRGFDTIKIKVGTTFKEDIVRVKAIREAVGPKVSLRIDANQAWSPKEALRIIDKLAEFDIEFVEQPVPSWDIDGLAYVTDHSSIPIMADESVLNARDTLRIVKERAADLINIKLMKCGGIREALKINNIAESSGVRCMLGCMISETNVSITAAASVGAALKNIITSDLDSIFALERLPMDGGVLAQGKKLILSDIPGLGLKVKDR